jgi:MFS family permease
MGRTRDPEAGSLERQMTARPSLRASIRTLPRGAWVLFAGTFINRFGSFLSIYLVLYLVGRGYSAAQAGLAVAATGVGAIVANGVGGTLADRFSRRLTIATSMAASAALTVLVPLAPSFPTVLLAVLLVGVAAQMYRPASGAILADMVAPEQRVAAYGVNRFAVNLGFALGPAAAGLLAGYSFLGHRFGLIFAGDALTSLAFAAIALLLLPETSAAAERAARPPGGYGTLLRDAGFLLVLGGGTVSALVYMQSASTFSLQVVARGLPTAAYGALLSLNGLLIILFELPLISVTQRFPPRRVMAVGALLSGLGFALTAVAHSLAALAATVAVWTLGEMISAPVGMAYLAEISPAHLRGRYQAAYGMSFTLSATLGPLAGLLLYGRSPVGLWLACGALGVVAATLILIGRPQSRPAEASAGVALVNPLAEEAV